MNFLLTVTISDPQGDLARQKCRKCSRSRWMQTKGENSNMGATAKLDDGSTLCGRLALTEKCRPSRISECLLPAAIKGILANFAEKPYPSQWLLNGPIGLGKTTTVVALVREINAQLHYVPAKLCTLDMVEKVCHDCYYAPYRMENGRLGGFHVVLVDEADVMTESAKNAFLSVLDGMSAPPETIFFFTTNDKQALGNKFISRCRTLEFTREGIEADLVTLLAKIWITEAPGHTPPDFDQIAHAADGDIRSAINHLEVIMLTGTSTTPLAVGDVRQNQNPAFHPLSQFFPEMSAESFAALKMDIEAQGVRVPVVVYQGSVLDGRSRWRAAQELGIVCPMVEFKGSNPLLEVVSLNAIRRDLTKAQRAMAAARIANMGEGRPSKTGSVDLVSEDKAARLFNVSVKSIQRAKEILRGNRPDLVDAVFAGTMSVFRAFKVVSTVKNGSAATKRPAKESPVPSAQNDDDSVWFWKEMMLFEQRRVMNRVPAELLAKMSETQSADVFRIAPTLIVFLQVLVSENWNGEILSRPEKQQRPE